MQKFINVHEVAENMHVPLTNLQATFDSHRLYASGKDKDPFGKSEFSARACVSFPDCSLSSFSQF